MDAPTPTDRDTANVSHWHANIHMREEAVPEIAFLSSLSLAEYIGIVLALLAVVPAFFLVVLVLLSYFRNRYPLFRHAQIDRLPKGLREILYSPLLWVSPSLMGIWFTFSTLISVGELRVANYASWEATRQFKLACDSLQVRTSLVLARKTVLTVAICSRLRT